VKVRRQYSLVVEQEATEYLDLLPCVPEGTPIYIGQTTQLWDFWDPRDGVWRSVDSHGKRMHQILDKEAEHEYRYR
jgi:hypothetical protein